MTERVQLDSNNGDSVFELFLQLDPCSFEESSKHLKRFQIHWSLIDHFNFPLIGLIDLELNESERGRGESEIEREREEKERESEIERERERRKRERVR